MHAATPAEHHTLEAEYEGADELPDEVDQRLGEIETALATFEARPVRFEAGDIGRAGVFISIAHDGSVDIPWDWLAALDTSGASGSSRASWRKKIVMSASAPAIKPCSGTTERR
ncbi:hypothetical protein [Azoarcus indigens]|uniref:Uncharacterized protein n=1 Tax=Azoarcus indigens TaxID=29545 RepID=A0A4R6EDU3_9RHOO|nr:hypothetical protein [Azoarcus indigens]TDN56365.1 hypothetical protein C7389_102301 [Azoarcus indigens]